MHLPMYEKNFSRIEYHAAAFSRDVRYAGDIHERDYFPGVEPGCNIDYEVPFLIYLNQKYPSTIGTGIPGCQRRFDFYSSIAKNQYYDYNTVFNFIHYLMANSDLNQAVGEFFQYLSGDKAFAECDYLTTYGMDFKPQIVDLTTLFLGLITSIKAIDNFYYHEETEGEVDMGLSFPYLCKIFDEIEHFYLRGGTNRDNGKPLTYFVKSIEEKVFELKDVFSDFQKYVYSKKI